jgi:hypothetical protein
VSEKVANKRVVIDEILRNSAKNDNLPHYTLSDGVLGMYIKRYEINNSLGYTEYPVYIIADEAVPVNEFELYKVLGLGAFPSPRSYGFLVFCNTRGTNAKFCKWYLEHIVFNFVEQNRAMINQHTNFSTVEEVV